MKTNELLQEKAKGTPPEWAAKEQADLRSFVQQFGYQLTTLKPEKGTMKGDTDMFVGGQLKDRGNELLSAEHRLQALKKGLAAYLLAKAKEERYVKVFNRSWWKHDPRYIFPEDTLRAAEAAIDSTVRITYTKYDHDRRFPELFVWYSITAPKP